MQRRRRGRPIGDDSYRSGSMDAARPMGQRGRSRARRGCASRARFVLAACSYSRARMKRRRLIPVRRALKRSRSAASSWSAVRARRGICGRVGERYAASSCRNPIEKGQRSFPRRARDGPRGRPLKIGWQRKQKIASVLTKFNMQEGMTSSIKSWGLLGQEE